MCLHIQKKHRGLDENGGKKELVCILCVEDSVCKRDNKEQSVCCNEGNFELTMYESQQAKESLREKPRARQPS